jgi:hypothetical protein
LGKRFGAILRLLEEQGMLGGGESRARDRLAARRELAWASIPSLSVTLYDRFDPDQGDILPLAVPFKFWSSQPRLPAIWPTHSSKSGFRRAEQPMSPVRRLFVEIGVETPHVRQLSVRLSDLAGDQLPPRLLTATTPAQQVLILDLNRLGALFTRRRDYNDPEATSRRSVRFTAHWLLAIRRTTYDLDAAAQAQIMVLGGDDLVVATRTRDVDLTEYPMRLQNHLMMLNQELPKCDRLSFSAGMARRVDPAPGRTLYEAALALERLGKQLWKQEALSQDVPHSGSAIPLSVLITRLPPKQRPCVIVAAPADIALQLPTASEAIPANAADKRYDISPEPELLMLSGDQFAAFVKDKMLGRGVTPVQLTASTCSLEIDDATGAAVIELLPKKPDPPALPDCETCLARLEQRKKPRSKQTAPGRLN